MQGKRADNMASVAKKAAVAQSYYGIFVTVIISLIMILIAFFSIFVGAHWYVSAGLFFTAAGIIVLSVVTMKRTSRININTLEEPVPESIALEQGEVVVDTIPAVMQYFVNRSTTYLGAGKVHHPENALVITNRAIWALTVPLAGADKVVGETDIGRFQWMWNYKDISDMLQEMLRTLPLEEVLKQGRAKRLMGIEELKAAKSRAFSRDIRLIRSDGRTFRYSIRLNEDYKRAKAIFKIG